MKIKKGLELVSRYFIEFFDKKFYYVLLHMTKFYYQTMFTLQVIHNMCFVFHARTFDDVMIFEYLKSYNLSQRTGA